jgi:hypothetical protein
VFRSGAGLKGGTGHRRGAQVRGVGVGERFTVQKASEVLARATDFSLRDFDQIFADCFNVIQAHSAASSFNPQRFYRHVYQTSGTFRRLVNYYDSATTVLRHWQIVVGDLSKVKPPGPAYTDLTNRKIYLPGDDVIETYRYMSAGGRHPFTSEQAYLHEMLHALTGAFDPEAVHNLLNRGPIVYLTDKILNEAGYRFPEQVMYRAENYEGIVELTETVEYRRAEAAHAANLENLHLDQQIDAALPAVSQDTLVEGVALRRRLTVSGVKKIKDEISRVDSSVREYREGYLGKFKHNFALATDVTTGSGAASEGLEQLVAFYGRLYKKSPTFRRLFDSMPATGAAADAANSWKFVLDKNVAIQELPPGRVAHGINDSTQKIYIFDDNTLYLGERGLHPVQYERKLTHEMVCIITGVSKIKAGEAFYNRGAALYYTDKILKEAGFSQPRQLVAALAVSLDPESEARLLSYQTSARRSAAIEDRYLAQ